MLIAITILSYADVISELLTDDVLVFIDSHFLQLMHALLLSLRVLSEV